MLDEQDEVQRPSVPLGQVVDLLEGLYPLDYAEDWDHPGLVAGDPSWPVRRIWCAVDPRPDVVQEALDHKADLLITHHPLFFRSVHQVSGLDFRGDIITRLIEGHCGLWVGHTNADAAYRGVAQAAADALGLQEARPLAPQPVSNRDLHADQGIQVGLGRWGQLPKPTPFEDLVHTVADLLRKTALGVQAVGPSDAMVSTVALLPGSGDSEFDLVRSTGADVYITSDLRHHPATDAYQQALYEARMAGRPNQPRPMLINTPHSAIESLWFHYAKGDIARALETATGVRPQVEVSSIVTDPWTMVVR
ncbi:Nif3-like dinuclear metal center hexameric protein [Bifidobacterium sp. ESL0820]|uniref:Nif3-like dinuclear metal center hexameric protein n=1 Tax=Bifidobacterium sp. ESL0820 TaxID=3448586 RepID=UPI004041F694